MQARKAIDLGFKLGIGGVVTYKNAGMAKVVEDVGIEHIVLETDSPYLPPIPYRGKRNESIYLKFIISKISDLLKISIEDVVNKTTKNAKEIFKKLT